MSTVERLKYDPSGVFLEDTGISQAELDHLVPRLNEIRQEVVEEDVRLLASPESVPVRKRPLDAGFLELPERLLSEYCEQRQTSEIGRILNTAKRIAEQVDRVVVLGIGGSYMGARALMEGCCQPYFNELSRAQRGSRPRMYFEGNNVDNDATRGLLDLLNAGRAVGSIDDRWAMVVISKSGGTLETEIGFYQFLAALRAACDGDQRRVAELIVPVTGKSGKLFEQSQALGCSEIFPVPDGVGGRFSILSAVGLVPAAILGLDIVKLLEGAVAMNQHFRTAPPDVNLVLNYVGVCHLMETRRGATIRVLSVWSKALEAVGLWYDQLLAESLGKGELGATPLTVVNTRDLHSRAQQHQEGRRDKLITNLIVDHWRCDPVPVGRFGADDGMQHDLADKSLPEVMSAAVVGTSQAYRQDGRPTADLSLPRVNEASLGQLFQMLMLATVVEGRLLGLNPYGQPGVEKYKQNMKRILGGS